MVKKLKQYFPPVWERNVILSEIGRKKELEDGSIFTVYYQKQPGDALTSILWTRWQI